LIFPSKTHDITIELPSGWQVSSLPAAQRLDAHVIVYSPSGELQNAAPDPELERGFSPDPKYYGALRNFFQVFEPAMRTDRPATGNGEARRLAGKTRGFLGAAVCLLACVSPAAAGGDAPQWMRAGRAPLPAHDDKTDAVLLFSEKTVTVLSTDKIKKTVRSHTRFCARAAAITAWSPSPSTPRRSRACMAGASRPEGKDMRSKTRMPWKSRPRSRAVNWFPT
jgi:hypothetical protein